jgi:hypothetical protein
VRLEHDLRFAHRRDGFDQSLGGNHDRARSVDRHVTTDDASGSDLQIGRLDGLKGSKTLIRWPSLYLATSADGINEAAARNW